MLASSIYQCYPLCHPILCWKGDIYKIKFGDFEKKATVVQKCEKIKTK